MLRKGVFALSALLLVVNAQAFAWGTKGHEIIGAAAARSFSSVLPSFLRTNAAQYEVMYLGPELDRLKGSGMAWDDENDPGHYLNADDNAAVGGIPLQNLPASREDYDNMLRKNGSSQYAAGYLPYAILEGWEQVRDEFAYWRVDNYETAHAATKAARDMAAEDRRIDESLIVRDVGVWGHFVEDASQPLHVSIHYNGWGKYPNPQGFTTSPRTHSFFESDFVDAHVSAQQVLPLMSATTVTAPAALLKQEQVMAMIADYLNGTLQAVEPLYTIEKAGGFANGTPQAVRFTASQLARGADELRDLVTLAWYDSLNERVGYPYRSVRDILNGRPPPKPFSD